MLSLINFNKLKKIFSLVLIVFFVLPLSRCERSDYSSERKVVSATVAARSQATNTNAPLLQEPAQQETKSPESRPSMAMDFYVCIYLRENYKKFDFTDWQDAALSALVFLSLVSMIFLPLSLWRLSETRSAVILLSASPVIAYGIFISVWLWPIQLFAGYLLTLIWMLLFVLSLLQIYRILRERNLARRNS